MEKVAKAEEEVQDINIHIVIFRHFIVQFVIFFPNCHFADHLVTYSEQQVIN